MANALFARTALPCNTLFTVTAASETGSGSGSRRPPVEPPAWLTDLVDASWRQLSERDDLRVEEIAGEPAILGPAVCIDEIDDLPEELKETLAAGRPVETRSAPSGQDVASERTDRGISLAADPGIAIVDIDAVPARDRVMRDGRAHRGPAKATAPGPVGYGPVFNTDEVSAARAFLTHLDTLGEARVHDDGLAIGGHTVWPDLCRKLAQIGLVTADHRPDGVLVTAPIMAPNTTEGPLPAPRIA